MDEMVRCHATSDQDVSDCRSRYVKVLHSRRRSEYRQPFLIRFRGRGGRSSTRNLQIVTAIGEIVFQMARWNEDEFTVDFKNPYTAYTAFGMALAQLEI